MEKLLLCRLLPPGTSTTPPSAPEVISLILLLTPAASAGVCILCWEKVMAQVKMEVRAASPGLGGYHLGFSASDPMRDRAETHHFLVRVKGS